MNDPIPLQPHLDQGRLRRAWRRAAPHFAAEGAFHQEMATQLLERVGELKTPPTRILELGDRSGVVADGIRRRWPGAALFGVGLEEATTRLAHPHRRLLLRRSPPAAAVALPGRLPFPDNTFDAVVANLSLHWEEDLAVALKECRRVLRQGGVLLFSTLGSRHLEELRSCLEELDQRRHGRTWPRVIRCPSLPDLGDLLLRSGFALPVVDRDTHCLRFASPLDLLHKLRRLGAGNHHTPRFPGLTGKGFLGELELLYRERFPAPRGAGVVATVEVVFGHGWKERGGGVTSRGCPLPPPL